MSKPDDYGSIMEEVKKHPEALSEDDATRKKGGGWTWELKPRGIGSNVDIYARNGSLVCHDVEYGIASTIKDRHNAALTVQPAGAATAVVQLPHFYAYSHEPTPRKLWDEDDMREYAAALEKPLVDALQMLRDYQNGCPLPSYEKGWNEAMAMTEAALAKVKEEK